MIRCVISDLGKVIIFFDNNINKSDVITVSDVSSTDTNEFIMQLKNYLVNEREF